MRKKFRITYDSDKEAVFFVHTPTKVIKFPETSEGIYAINMENMKSNDENIENDKENTCNVITIKNNMKYFSQRQIKEAKKCEKFYLY